MERSFINYYTLLHWVNFTKPLFRKVKPTSAFGTAGTVILIMMWINYTCMLIFFGAKFTKVYAYKKVIKLFLPSTPNGVRRNSMLKA